MGYDPLEDYLDDDSLDDPKVRRLVFAAEGSALRASSRKNPRNLPCPSCERPNRLTPADVARHYVCDHCANEQERGGF